MEGNKTKIQNKILKAIETGEIKMRPKWFFILKSLLFAIGITFAVLALLYITSFIIFTLRVAGLWFMPSSGPRPLVIFILSLPWLLILLALGAVIALEAMVRKSSFGFTRPLIYSALGVVVLATVGGFAIEKTEFHNKYSGMMYERVGAPQFSNLHPCIVSATSTEGEFTCLDEDDNELDVTISPQTHMISTEILLPEDEVIVVGREDDGKVEAIGVRKIDEKMPYPKSKNKGKGQMMRIKNEKAK